MAILMDVVIFLGVVALWVWVVPFGRRLSGVESMSKSVMNIFDSMKASAEYLDRVLAVGKSLHVPEDIENVVKIKVAAALAPYGEAAKRHKADLSGAQEEVLETSALLREQGEEFQKVMQILAGVGIFSASVMFYLSEERTEAILKRLGDYPAAMEFLGTRFAEVKKVRSERPNVWQAAIDEAAQTDPE